MARRWQLEQVQVIERPLPQVFSFFSDAQNLERLTPTSVGFRIRSPLPVEMKEGAIIDYSLRVSGVPVKWTTRIESFEPEHQFVDVQLAGPYRYWRHLHEFEPHPDGTRMRDVVEYELPFGPLGRLALLPFVRRELKHIFEYRRRSIEHIFNDLSD